MEKEVLRLFKGYLVKNEKGKKIVAFSKKALEYGILINENIEYSIIEEAIRQYGKDGQKWNETFHKDFEIVRHAPIEDLIIQQIMHYITTYGFEELGVYNSDTIYIPKEKLEIPELNIDKIELINIQPLTSAELTAKLMVLLTSGIALSEQTIKDVMVLSDFIDKNRFDEIQNREVKTALYDKYNVMPQNPEDFLRFLLFKATNTTLKISNVQMIRDIQSCDKKMVLKMLQSYLMNTPNGYEKLSSIFFRNKNLFLALKRKKQDATTQPERQLRANLNYIINKLRKLANKYHKPLKKNLLECLTDGAVDIDLEELRCALDGITVFREIRLLNGVLYRLNGNNNIIYKIRNGKSYVKKLELNTAVYAIRLHQIAETIKKHLIVRLSKHVKGKTIYIPDNVTYAAPTSEKQFNGNIPEGSYLEVPRDCDLVYGVYWKNIANGKSSHKFYGEESSSVSQERVDLDLKQMNKNEVFGWDAAYRSANSDILFSGDMTDAKLPRGASELFYVGQNYGHGAFLITLNMFTNNSEDVPFEFVIAKATQRPIERTYHVLDPNNILEKIDMVIKKGEPQMVVGFITIGDTIRFYFNDFSAGGDVKTPRGYSTSARNDITMGAFDYLQSYSKIQIKLNDLLKDAGAIITDKPTITKFTSGDVIVPIETPVDIDLSPNVITRESLIKLLSGE